MVFETNGINMILPRCPFSNVSFQNRVFSIWVHVDGNAILLCQSERGNFILQWHLLGNNKFRIKSERKTYKTRLKCRSCLKFWSVFTHLCRFYDWQLYYNCTTVLLSYIYLYSIFDYRVFCFTIKIKLLAWDCFAKFRF